MILRSLVGSFFLSLIVCAAAADDPSSASKSQSPLVAAASAVTPSAAVEKALTFLVDDTAKWRSERGCATCHHGTLTVWALGEAASRGYAIDAANYADTLKWTKDLFIPRLKGPRDTRPGWSLVSTPGIYLGIMSQDLPILSRSEVNLVADHLARHQEQDGAWDMPPPKNGAPPIWESRETLALLALLAWEPHQAADAMSAAEANRSREKALEWLRSATPTSTTQSLTLRLLYNVRNSAKLEQLKSDTEQLLKRQNPDGGWSQTADFPSDAYATGQALYALAEAGMTAERTDIQRAVAFLATTQQPNGSWNMTSRDHPGVESTRKPLRNPIPITYFGAAWATLGLVRFVPSAVDSPARQQRAFDNIRAFHGKYELDEQQPGKPVVRVDLRYYEVSNDELTNFTKLLTAFPQLTTLELKSKKISDVGASQLVNLPQLKSVTLQNCELTDAGLARLHALKQLERLNVAGIKVTDAGVAEIQKALPNLKIEK